MCIQLKKKDLEQDKKIKKLADANNEIATELMKVQGKQLLLKGPRASGQTSHASDDDDDDEDDEDDEDDDDAGKQA